jgi:hypothetical protein
MQAYSVRREIVRLAQGGLDVRGLSLRSAAAPRRAVPLDGLCVLTIDPATVLPTVGVSSRGELVARLLFQHYAPRLLPANGAGERSREPRDPG